jgi:CBS domain-containing protein
MESVQLTCGAVPVVSGRSALSELLLRPPVAVEPACTLGDAVAVMESAGVSALLVAELPGIITERDIARALGHGLSVADHVDRVATLRPVVVPGSMTVVEACATMLNEHVRHLVVDLADGWTVVSLRDVAAVLLQGADSELWLTSLRVTIDVPTETWLG